MTTNTTLAIGQVVKLKSGGPEMTIRSLPSPTYSFYSCQWFAGKKLEHGDFPHETLVLVPLDDK